MMVWQMFHKLTKCSNSAVVWECDGISATFPLFSTRFSNLAATKTLVQREAMVQGKYLLFGQ
jgi:hypothetical protein